VLSLIRAVRMCRISGDVGKSKSRIHGLPRRVYYAARRIRVFRKAPPVSILSWSSSFPNYERALSTASRNDVISIDVLYVSRVVRHTRHSDSISVRLRFKISRPSRLIARARARAMFLSRELIRCKCPSKLVQVSYARGVILSKSVPNLKRLPTRCFKPLRFSRSIGSNLCILEFIFDETIDPENRWREKAGKKVKLSRSVNSPRVGSTYALVYTYSHRRIRIARRCRERVASHECTTGFMWLVGALRYCPSKMLRLQEREQRRRIRAMRNFRYARNDEAPHRTYLSSSDG